MMGRSVSDATPCAECAAPLAHDQRYCVECGTRHGPLPAFVADLIGGTVPGEAAPEPPPGDNSGRSTMPTARAAAVAVLSVLGFGAILGTVVSPAADSQASSPLVVALSPPATSSSVPAPAPAAPADTSSPSAPSSVTPTAAPIQPAPSQPAPADNTGGNTPAPPAGPALPPIKHVFMIVLSDQGYDQAFGPSSQAPYLAKTLTSQGELLPNYYAVAQGGLANQIALLSGQGPTQETTANCPDYTDIMPGTIGSDGQVSGNGCVYPHATQTLADQLTAAGLEWKAYVEDIGNGPPGEAKTCRHPAPGAQDSEQSPRPGDAYVTWRNPFVYFHSLTDGSADPCTTSDVGLDQLPHDLKLGTKAPALAYIVPNRCHDGSEQPCAPGAQAGLPAADAFLHQLVPEIEKSPAYKDAGLIAITFDEAPQTGPNADPSACCNTPQYPNLGGTTGQTGPTGATGPTGTTGPTDLSGQTTPTGGGGRVGLLLISPYVKAGSTNDLSYFNHYALLKSLEALFDLNPPLGYAADPALLAFDKTIYNAQPKAAG